ncbi:MAG: 30S ribosomal protein S12 methylthiotransferase RimO [Defluviitaleaceae bacterium]|nr:30S ribosomal protein S12 methylthiotransferase RimO [Defluviitaleaceae bacterium]
MENTFNNLKFALISLGCDKNTVDSEVMLGMLAGTGATFVSNLSRADVIIINTCGFLKDAVDESKEKIESAVVYRESGSCRALVVTGCAATRYRAEFEANPHIDLVVGVAEYGEFIPKLSEILGQPMSPNTPAPRIPSTPKHYAYLKIAEGCDRYCSYCTIPAIRGAYTSRPVEELVEEARYLAGLGVRELILVAQDTTLYGTDIYGEQRLHILLGELAKIEGIHWLRLLYSYPEHIYDELLDVMAREPKVLPYLDLPIQHSSDKILGLMNRKSTERALREIITKIRARVPDIVLRTTLIAGFPGEDKKDFQALCDFIQEMEFERLGVFAYSREEGTPADKLPDHLEEKTKNARRERLMKIQQEISKKKLAKRIGTTLLALVDGAGFGRTYGEAPEIDGVVEIAPESTAGNFVHVKITAASEYDMIGEIYEPSK